MVGDAAMVWDSLFLVGIIAFAVAHFFYITALNTKGKGVFGNDFLRRLVEILDLLELFLHKIEIKRYHPT